MQDPSLDYLHRRISDLERRVDQKFLAPTVPTYDSSNFPQDAVHGQIAKDASHNAWVYGEDDTWHQIGAGAAGYPKMAYISAANLTHSGGSGSGNSFYVDFASNKFWTNSASDFEYGIDTNGQPTKHTIRVKTPGVYRVSIQAAYFSGTAGVKYSLYWNNAVIPAQMQLGNPDTIYSASAQNQGFIMEMGYVYNTGTTLPSGGAVYMYKSTGASVIFYPALMIEKMNDFIPTTVSL